MVFDVLDLGNDGWLVGMSSVLIVLAAVLGYAAVAIRLVARLGAPGLWGSVLLAFVGVPLICSLLLVVSQAPDLSLAEIVPFLAAASLLGLSGGGVAAGTLAVRLRRPGPLDATPGAVVATGSAFLAGIVLFLALLAIMGLTHLPV